jgi:uncharacterized delta-60 repeat protein
MPKPHKRGRPSVGRRSFRPRLEALERRDVPSGGLDPTFGSGGLVNVTGGDNQSTFVTSQADGKLLIVAEGDDGLMRPGQLTLLRYNADGTPDTSFGGGTGRVSGSFPGNITSVPNFPGLYNGWFLAGAAAAAADGKIVVAGELISYLPVPGTAGVREATQFSVLRFNGDGTLDTTFGQGGQTVTAVGLADSARAVTVQADGKVVVAGSVRAEEGWETQFAVVRYDTDGALDGSFGTGGVVTTAVGDSAAATAVAVAPDGRIVVAGVADLFPPGPSTYLNVQAFALARYNADGSLDSSFGTGGTTTTQVQGLGSVARDLALAPDGSLVVGGVTLDAPGPVPGPAGILPPTKHAALARYDAGGRLDPGFGSGGTLVVDLPGLSIVFDARMRLEPDGKIVLGTTVTPDLFSMEIALARLNADGSPDASFGTNGLVTTTLGNGLNPLTAGTQLWDLAVQPDGQIVIDATVAGKRDGEPGWSNYWPVLARFDAGGSLPGGGQESPAALAPAPLAPVAPPNLTLPGVAGVEPDGTAAFPAAPSSSGASLPDAGAEDGPETTAPAAAQPAVGPDGTAAVDLGALLGSVLRALQAAPPAAGFDETAAPPAGTVTAPPAPEAADAALSDSETLGSLLSAAVAGNAGEPSDTSLDAPADTSLAALDAALAAPVEP